MFLLYILLKLITRQYLERIKTQFQQIVKIKDLELHRVVLKKLYALTTE